MRVLVPRGVNTARLPRPDPSDHFEVLSVRVRPAEAASLEALAEELDTSPEVLVAVLVRLVLPRVTKAPARDTLRAIIEAETPQRGL